MAIELTRKRLQAAFGDRPQRIHLPPHVLAGLALGVVVVALAAMLAGIHNAQRDEAGAHQRYLDAEVLASLPPLSTDTLRSELETAKAQLAWSKAVEVQTVDASSDATIAHLVRAAEGTGLSVRGVAHADAATAKIDSTTYDVQGIRIIVEGAPRQAAAFLTTMQRDLPALVPLLISSTINEAGVARTELVFNTYTPQASATPVTKAAR